MESTYRRLKAAIATFSIPFVRQAMQGPAWLRPFLWHHVVRHLDWRGYRFVERAHFGALFAGTTTDVIQRYIYYFGHWDPPVEAVIQQRLRPGDTFIDIGANIGYYSLFAAAVVGKTGRVVSIEASHTTFELLMDNLRRNHALDVVRPIWAAVGSQSGTVTLHRPGHGNLGAASMIRSAGVGSEEVPAETLGGLLTESEILSARFIKIDVEGAEGLVIEGMAPILPKLGAGDILVEISPELSSSRNVIDLLTKYGWRPYKVVSGPPPESYFKAPVSVELVPLLGPPTERVDILFHRDVGTQG